LGVTFLDRVVDALSQQLELYVLDGKVGLYATREKLKRAFNSSGFEKRELFQEMEHRHLM
jgi:hypothetical protein